ncbi:MAG: tryptophan-rich sensory protein [Clostridiales bacterium]|nr:tryptophan-rich sensory protein [Clostridiales bacterium]
MKKFLPLIISIGGTLAVGGLAAWLTRDSYGIYSMLEKPALSPPAVLFPIVWGILYVLMGISVYLIYRSDCKNKDSLIELYIIQLAVNFVWPLIFFNWQMFFASFIWLVLLWFLIILMTVLFFRCSRTAAYLLIPYLLWVTFAGYLNYSVYLLN